MVTLLLLVNIALAISILYHVLTATVFVLSGQSLGDNLKSSGGHAFFWGYLLPLVANLFVALLFCAQGNDLMAAVGATILGLYCVEALASDHLQNKIWIGCAKQLCLPIIQTLLAAIAFMII